MKEAAGSPIIVITIIPVIFTIFIILVSRPPNNSSQHAEIRISRPVKPRQPSSDGLGRFSHIRLNLVHMDMP